MSSLDDANLAMSATGYCEGVPMNVEELKDITGKNNWFKAIDEEVNSLVESETWKEVILPEGKKAIQKCIVNTNPYRELVGSLMFACLTTRPDISAAVNFYSQFQTGTTEVQWIGLKRVLRHRKGTLDLGLRFKGISDVPLLGYADADFANRQDRKCVTGYLFEMYCDAASWATKKLCCG
ncbi:hypothetical protein PR048_012419 [Dryococelus australis]|uniref:Uncharacterized protein n=1 Tax=Dryococelus australis TaxID=614101 RepID=A0ABQ9HPY0_9NEOP|nr:hypothetical protein PR048_012419 [Dryococelus australis]